MRPIWSFLIFVLVAGCLSPLDFPVARRGSQVILSGFLNTLTEEEQVITVATTLAIASRPEPTAGAEIWLLQNGVRVAPYLETTPGRYVLTPTVIAPEQTYQAEVQLPDGRKYLSAPQIVPAVAATARSSGQFQLVETIAFDGNIANSGFYQVSAEIFQFPRNSYLRIQTQETWLVEPTNFPDIFNAVPPPCYVTTSVDPQRINLVNTIGSSNEPIRLQVASRSVDVSFLKRHYFTVYVSAITADAYEYWRKVNILANQMGSIFDVPPAEIMGNWRNVNDPTEKVWGFFQVSNTTFSRFFVVGSEIPLFLGSYCEYNSNIPPDQYLLECINCLTLPGSTLNRPPWWLD
jgi:hypothetical protein